VKGKKMKSLPAARPARGARSSGRRGAAEIDHTQDDVAAARLLEELEFRHGIDVSTLDVSIREGRVTARGYVSDPDELESLKETIQEEQGVGDLECAVQIAPTRREEDRDQARAVQEALEGAPDLGSQDIQVACINRAVVLRGTVNSQLHKVTAGMLALRQAQVQRVRNRLVVVEGVKPTSRKR
jgi:osmotically-inducible protein OsmY